MATFNHRISKHLDAHKCRVFFLIKLQQTSWDVFAGIAAELSKNRVDRATTAHIFNTSPTRIDLCHFTKNRSKPLKLIDLKIMHT